MPRPKLLIVAVQAVLVFVLVAAVASGRVPLGVPGEWEWPRVRGHPEPVDVALALLAVAAYAGFVAAGLRALTRNAGPARQLAWLAGLMGAAVAIAVLVPMGAPFGYGLPRWAIVPYYRPASGYYSIAKAQVGDARRFLADYPDWIRRQDALHIGTHPPGLIVAHHAALRFMERSPGLARWFVGHLPDPILAGFRSMERRGSPIPVADRAALALVSLAIVILCAATVLPLYVLARSSLEPAGAWATAALWPLVPSALLFQPVADTAYPFLATLAPALAAGSGPTRRGMLCALGAGVVLAAGMQLTLAFLPVGLVVAIAEWLAPVHEGGSGRQSRLRAGLVAVTATGVGFLLATCGIWALTRANPFVIWWWNQRNHARFYREYARSYPAWVVVNLIEAAVGLGLPASVWCGVGLAYGRRSIPRFVWATLAVLALLNFSGRNLGEVARLWLPLFPPLLIAAGSGMERLRAGPATVLATLLTLGLQTLALEALIQVVYPL